MAPERFTNDEVTYRADVYALACVLHECLTGSQPYTGDSVGTIITAHLMNPTPRPSGQRPGIPAAFDQVIARGMAKKPADRFASAGDLATAATEALTHREQDQAATILQRSEAATRPVPPPPPSQPRMYASQPTPPPYPTHAPAAICRLGPRRSTRVPRRAGRRADRCGRRPRPRPVRLSSRRRGLEGPVDSHRGRRCGVRADPRWPGHLVGAPSPTTRRSPLDDRTTIYGETDQRTDQDVPDTATDGEPGLVRGQAHVDLAARL